MCKSWPLNTNCTQEDHINLLCDAVPSVARQHCPSLLPQAQLIADKHRKSLQLFSACHNIYERNYVDTNEMEKLCM